jgi:hypothetical protein
LNPDRAGQDFDQSKGVAVIVDAGTVIRRPYFENGHASRAKSLMWK